MNNIIFQEGGFPLHTDTLEFMQATYGDALRFLAAVGGDNYILYGCQESGSIITDGAVVIGGEIFPFKQGTKQTNVVIRETKKALVYEDGDSKDSFISRWVEFGSGVNQVAWTSLKRIENLQELKAKIEHHQHTIPTGLISMWSGQDVPGGWVLCDGENGTPDLRNKFIMGASDESPIGTTGGAKEVTLTADQMPKHSHSLSDDGEHNHTVSVGSGGSHSHTYSKTIIATKGKSRSDAHYRVEGNYGTGTTSSSGSHTHNASVQSAGSHSHTVGESGGGKAHENRPPFYALAFIMKL
jgi:microcystin-dependent protein